MKKNSNLAASFKLGASAVALLAIVGASSAALAQNEDLETVVVTGFRASLEKALDIKRNSLDSSDSILAEDIAKFPDMNVSESLQRIPGVALNRESGEGREITVRGLGAQFTRVLINGVEAIATVGSQDVSTSNPGSGAGGTNRGRGFDFNVFASDLFTALKVSKSNSASLEEGSLGATVQLQTARPFDHPGFILTTSAQAGYQSLAGSINPRFAALVSNTFLGGRVGFLFSGAYGTTNTLEEGTSSVRWMSQLSNSVYNPTVGITASTNQFGSVAGTTCPSTVTLAAPGPAACVAADSAFRPRFPRYDIVSTHSKRLGLTGSLQWQPDDKTLFTVDGLFADFAQERNENYLEANAFSVGSTGTNANYVVGTTTYHASSLGVRTINLLTYATGTPGVTADSTGALMATPTMISGTATNVGLRAEHRLDHLDTRFMQITVDGTHEFSDTFKTHLLVGWSESHHRNPVQATLAMDLGCTGAGAAAVYTCGGVGSTTDPYAFDYSQGNMPMLHLGAVSPNASWFLSNLRERQEFASNSYRSVATDFEWKANKEVTITGGFDHRNFGYNTLETRRSTGGTGELATIPDNIRAVDINSYVKNVSLKGIDVPAGSTTSWNVPDLDKAATAISLWDQTVFPLNKAAGYGATGTVRENDFAGWIQAAWDTEVAGMSFRGDAGVRYVQTSMHSLGYTLVGTTITPVDGKNVYHDWLPAANLVLAPWDDFQIRFDASYALTRPNLGGMLPTGSVSVSGANATASVGNPKIPPMRSKNLDMAFEWYYGKGSLISIAGFWKHLDNFVQSAQSAGNWTTNPWGWTAERFVGACGGTGTDWSTITNATCQSQGGSNMNWTYSYSASVKGAPLYGTEINWQQQFYFLPDPFSNFGLLANYTYVQAQQKYFDTAGKLLMQADLNNMSRNSYNGTVYYDDEVFQARLTGAFRSHYLIDPNITTNYNNYGIFVKSSFNLDASTSYKVNEKLMFTFDAMNLTNQASNIYADKFAQRSYQFHKTGQVFYFGVKYNY
ncbi:MAG: TonB-dependent receptor [Rhizomicrobium sp.]|nr:TonB-dependent receptor [Rhizomicrobium sp.]